MRPIATIDCETDPFDLKLGVNIRPFIWGVLYDGQFAHFKTFAEALKWLQDFRIKMVVYAHNGGRFDYIFPEVTREILSGTPLKIIHGRLAKFKIGDIEFRDSLCAVPVALAKYKKSDMAYWKLKKQHRQKYMEEIIKYLKSDVVNLHELMTSYIEDYGPGLTLSSASNAAACRIEGFETAKSTPAYFRDLKPWYYGGMVRCFTPGKIDGPVRGWDLNSAYPYAMKHDHPWGGVYHLGAYKGGPIAGPTCLELNCESRGVFPHGEIKFGTKYPDDGVRRDYRVTGWEYNAAKELGLLGKNPKIGGVYKFGTRNFKKYVNHFYDLRMSSPEGSPQRLFGKLFMNSFYGKQGQDGSAYEQYLLDEPAKAEELALDGWQLREETPDGRFIYFRPEPKDKWRFYDVATALSVTGFVRAMLTKNIAAARKAGSTVHYCDTDSLHTTGPWAPKQSTELGGWKLEDVATTAYYGGKKLYALKLKGGGWKKAHKGVVLTGDQVADIAENGITITYSKEAPSMGILSGMRMIQRKVRRTN